MKDKAAIEFDPEEMKKVQDDIDSVNAGAIIDKSKLMNIPDLKQLLHDVQQVMSGYALDETWSEWDESVRKRVVGAQYLFEGASPVAVQGISKEGWVSVEDRKPEIPERFFDNEMELWITPLSVQIILYNGEDVFEGTYHNNGSFSSWAMTEETPTHWRYFPAPPGAPSPSSSKGEDIYKVGSKSEIISRLISERTKYSYENIMSTEGTINTFVNIALDAMEEYKSENFK